MAKQTWLDWYADFKAAMGGTLAHETKYRIYWEQGYTALEAAYEEKDWDWDGEAQE